MSIQVDFQLRVGISARLLIFPTAIRCFKPLSRGFLTYLFTSLFLLRNPNRKYARLISASLTVRGVFRQPDPAKKLVSVEEVSCLFECRHSVDIIGTSRSWERSGGETVSSSVVIRPQLFLSANESMKNSLAQTGEPVRVRRIGRIRT